MGEETSDSYSVELDLVPASGEGDRIPEWELGLPAAEDLTPISQSLISRELAAAFHISPEPSRTLLDVQRASDSTISTVLCRDLAASAAAGGGGGGGGKRQRLVWTPNLHQRFVDAVSHLGAKGAVPKAIVQLMNVEGLTRENVASHLQKYRLYLKRTRPEDEDGVPQASPSSSLSYGAPPPPPPPPPPALGVGHRTGPVAIAPVNGGPRYQNGVAICWSYGFPQWPHDDASGHRWTE